MEHLQAKAGEPFFAGDGPPTLFAVGCADGVVHLLRFGPNDQLYDVKREADRLRKVWGRQKRFDRRRGKVDD